MRDPIHPGETLREDLDALGMSASESACQERDVPGRLAALEGPGRGPAAAVVDVAATVMLGEEPGELGAREAGHLREIALTRPCNLLYVNGLHGLTVIDLSGARVRNPSGRWTDGVGRSGACEHKSGRAHPGTARRPRGPAPELGPVHRMPQGPRGAGRPRRLDRLRLARFHDGQRGPRGNGVRG